MGMGVLMGLKLFSLRDLQNLQAMITAVKNDGGDLQDIGSQLEAELASRLQFLTAPAPSPAVRRRPDNLTSCSVCGSPAVIIPLSPADRSSIATHAVQCQNRPATDHPWRSGMCGHTEYIVRGER